MMRSIAAILVVSTVTWPAILQAAESCLEEVELKRIDGQFEQDLVTGNRAFLEDLLAEEFLWIHNQVSSVDTKKSLVGDLVGRDRQPVSRSRVQFEVQIRRAGDTAVITGYTRIERHEDYVKRTGSARTPTYHFMRTYALVDGRCLLLGNHTMLMQNRVAD